MVDGPQGCAGPTRGAHDVCEDVDWESYPADGFDSAKAALALADSCCVAVIFDWLFDHAQHSLDDGIQLAIAVDDSVGC
jgi:hypothetical protein